MRLNLNRDVQVFLRACKRASLAIKKSMLTGKYVYLSLGISKATYYQRLSKNNWLPDELMIIEKLLKNEMV